jgi:hypothetical protein
MTARALRRLPGIQFEVPPPALDEILPRMDIAAFVGFAASGPIDAPVAVESAAEFAEIFGQDTDLAWDPDRGETVRAQLAPAVRAFFRNGGLRCWVVRVAERPSVNYFPLAGIVRLSEGLMSPAFARSRSAGSASDALRVGVAVLPTPIDVVQVTPLGQELVIEASVVTTDDLEPGDLVRIEYGDEFIVFVTIADVRAVETSPPSERPHVLARGRATWFRDTRGAVPDGWSPRAIVYTAAREPSGASETFAGDPVPILNTVEEWSVPGEAGTVRLNLAMAPEDAPEPGGLVSVDLGAEQLWVSVREAAVFGQDVDGTGRIRVDGRGLWWLKHPPELFDAAPHRCERLELELWLRTNDVQTVRLGELGLTPKHRRYWADLQDDDARYGDLVRATPPRRLWAERFFPLAGAGPGDAVYLPLDGLLAPDRFLGAARQPRTALERDGLSVISPSLFLDLDLVTPLTESLLAAAEHLRYTSPSPRRLRGVHAILDIEEVTIVAAPDAAHRGWKRQPLEDPPKPERSRPGARPDWGTFIDCGMRVIKAPRWTPRFRRRPLRLDAGTYTLEWSGQPGESFVLEEARETDWSDAVTIHSGSEARVTIYGRPRGTYYYRVRAVADSQASNWSRGIIVVVAGAQPWQVVNPLSYSPDTLLAVHRGILRMCAARGDVFALLDVPEHYRADDALAHIALLKNPAPRSIVVADERRIPPISLAFGAGETRVFSYAAVYHPWLFVREHPGADGLARVAPDGSMAGVMAARALSRGAWIAPANEGLRSVVGLSPAVGRLEAHRALEHSLNVIGQEPRGFVPLSANTLSDDPDLGAVNVRRLLSLLRRLALREGATYVFQPHDATFRRTVQRGFEAVLTRMFEGGAFAGRSANAAFQVTTNDSVNTPQSVDQGRFIVELRVAPSRPMTFLTVRLVQSGDRTLVLEGG